MCRWGRSSSDGFESFNRVVESMTMRILLISRHFLDGTSEGLCAGRTAGALAIAGHEVVVVTDVRVGNATSLLVPGLDEVRIVPVGANMLRWERLWAYCNERASRTWLHRLVSASLNLRNFSNGRDWAWVRHATEAGLREIDSAQEDGAPFDVVFSRLNPVASHQVAHRLLRKVRQPAGRRRIGWCTYFSDPWPHFTYPSPFQYSAGPLARRRGLAVLRSFAHRADSLLFPSERLAGYMAGFMAQSGALSKEQVLEKSFIAPHIGMPSDAVALRQVEKGAALKIRHAGFLMGERRVSELFQALSRLPREARAEINIEFMGRKGTGDHDVPENLAETVTFLDARPPDEAFAWMSKAHVALLVESDFDEGVFLPSKFAEYATMGRPILALSPENGTIADYLSVGGGIRVGPSNVAEIHEALLALHERWKTGSLDELVSFPSSVSGSASTSDSKDGDSLASKFWPETVVPQIERALRAACGPIPR